MRIVNASELTCPLSGEEYIIEEWEDFTFRIYCPTPAVHKCSEFYFDSYDNQFAGCGVAAENKEKLKQSGADIPVCQANMKEIATAVMQYAAENDGNMPESLNELYEKGLLYRYPTCPLAEKPYDLEVYDDNQFTIFCPSPAGHGLEYMYLDSQEGAVAE